MRSQIPAASLPWIGDRRLLGKRAYDALREAIVRLELAPGQALTERGLSERLGVSKSPIRDALIRLEREGLVRSSPFKGFEVAPLSEADCREVFPFREALEVYCVEWFARGHDAVELAAIEQTHREHAAILDAVRARDGATAARRMRAHIHSVLDQVVRSDEFQRYAGPGPGAAVPVGVVEPGPLSLEPGVGA